MADDLDLMTDATLVLMAELLSAFGSDAPLPDRDQLKADLQARHGDQQQLAYTPSGPAVAGAVELPVSGWPHPAASRTQAMAVVDEIQAAATRAAVNLSHRARREIQAIVRSQPRNLWESKITAIMKQYGPRFARLLRDARVAAALAGARRLPAAPNLPTVPATSGYNVPPPQTPWTLPALPDHHGPGVTLPVIDEAVRDLSDRQVMTRDRFDALEDAERQRAFTVSGLESETTIQKLRDLLTSSVASGGTLRDFSAGVDEAMAGGTILAPDHLETVFRTNVLGAYSRGLDAVLDTPGVGEAFPYAEYHATHDTRVRDEHFALERCGIGGGPIYRRDDPVWLKFRPPWGYNCRCTWSPLTVEQAAQRGIPEAIEWLRTGQPPLVPTFVPHPPFDIPSGWQRLALGEPETADVFLTI